MNLNQNTMQTRTNTRNEVTKFLDDLNHPLRKEIDQLRSIILGAYPGLAENIKWNGPNYSYNGEDRITMRIHPPKQIQVIFHRGAKKQAQPPQRLIEHESRLLQWKENDRALMTFTNKNEIKADAAELKDIVSKWMAATSQ